MITVDIVVQATERLVTIYPDNSPALSNAEVWADLMLIEPACGRLLLLHVFESMARGFTFEDVVTMAFEWGVFAARLEAVDL